MAEEMFTQWEKEELVKELLANSQGKLWRAFEEHPTVDHTSSHQFRFTDADGKPIEFPITMISDTKISPRPNNSEKEA